MQGFPLFIKFREKSESSAPNPASESGKITMFEAVSTLSGGDAGADYPGLGQ